MKRGDVLNLTNGITVGGTNGLKMRVTFEKGKGVAVLVLGAMKPDGSLLDPKEALGKLGWAPESQVNEMSQQLNAVDAVLAGRDALDDKPDRVAKILHAINTAKQADPLAAERDRLRASVATWQECAADRDREIERLRTSLEAAAADARRYRRLRVLGCALGGSAELDRALVSRFTNLDEAVDRDLASHPSRGEAEEATP